MKKEIYYKELTYAIMMARVQNLQSQRPSSSPEAGVVIEAGTNRHPTGCQAGEFSLTQERVNIFVPIQAFGCLDEATTMEDNLLLIVCQFKY